MKMTIKKTIKKTVKGTRAKKIKSRKPTKPTLKTKLKPEKKTAGGKISKKETQVAAKKKIVRVARYFEAIGRRKTAIARVRLFAQGEKEVLINGQDWKNYFPILENQQTAISSLEKMKALGRFRVSVKVRGGGVSAQAEAVRHGISRALLKFNPDFRKKLRRAGFLTRDPRMRERKKFGLKRARRAPQWRKR